MKMKYVMACVGMLYVCGCCHTLEVLDLEQYSIGKTNRELKRNGNIFVKFETATLPSRRFQEEFVEVLEARTKNFDRKREASVKGGNDLTLLIRVREFMDGKTSNFAISWPGFIIFMPGWYGYGYTARYKVNVEIYVGNDPVPVKNVFIPINLELRHADLERTWAATGTGWLASVSAFINGFYCMTYDPDITMDFYNQTFRTIAEYAVNEVVNELKAIDSGAEIVETAAEEKSAKVETNAAVEVREVKEERRARGGEESVADVVQTVVKENPVEGYRKAAMEGDAEAQYALGACYELGNGVEKSYAKAVKWYRQSAGQGNEKAKAALEKLLGGK